MDNTGKSELTIEELIDEIELQKWEKGNSNFQVSELFTKRGHVLYEVTNLTMETEGEIVYCYDSDDIIQSSHNVLVGFVKSQVLNIYQVYTEYGSHIEIWFRDGLILININ